MDLIIPKSLAGKYFINHLHVAHGGGMLLRGRVVGPVASELSPFYLCDIYPADDSQIAITTQTIMPLEQLVGVYFYESREQQLAAWTETQRQILVNQRGREKQRKQAIAAMITQMLQRLAAHGIKVVEKREVEAAATQIAAMTADDGGGSVGRLTLATEVDLVVGDDE